MTVVAAYLYRHGARVRPVSIDEKIDCPQDKFEFVWIGIAIICTIVYLRFRRARWL